MPAELFRIVGVSFDGRQELLTAIGKGALAGFRVSCLSAF
jgi:hypothetical protein